MTDYRGYRGKVIDGGEWVQGYYLVQPTTLGDKTHIIYDGEYEHAVDPSTVGQYTGIHDCECENHLFEGNNIRMEYEGEIITGNIQYCGGGFILASDDFEDGYMWLSDLTENDGAHFWIPTAVLLEATKP